MLTVSINGTDRSSSLEWESLTVQQIRSSQVDSCSFRLVYDGVGQTFTPQLNDEVLIEHDSEKVFAGVIVRREQTVSGPNMITYSIEAASFERIFDRRLVVADLSGEKGTYIINSFVNDYANALRIIAATFESDETWVDEDGTSADETSDIVYGEQARGATLGTSDTLTMRKEQSLDFSTLDDDSRFTLWIKCSNATNLASFRLRFGEETGGTYTNYFEKSITSGFVNGWKQIVLDRSDFTETGAPDWASIETVQVQAVSNSGGGLDIVFDDLRLIPEDGFTQQNVLSVDLEVNYGRFSYEPLFQVFSQISENNGWDWYIDADRDLNFFPTANKSAPFSLDDTSANYLWESLAINVDISNIYNEVYIVGGEEAGTEQTDDLSQQADGDNDNFLLPYRYKDVSVTVNTGSGPVTQDLGLDNIDQFSDGYDVLFNFQEKLLRFNVAPAEGDIIEITGKPYLPIVVSEADLASITEYGTFQFYKEDKSINTRDSARELALGLLEQHRQALNEGTFQTYEEGLHAGQEILIDSTLRGITENFIINELRMTMISPEQPLYEAVLVSSRTYGMIEILIQLLRKKEPVGDESLILPAYNALEEIQAAEQITASTAQYSLPETIEADEDTSETDFAPNWVAGPYSPTDIFPTDLNRECYTDRDCVIE